MEEQKLTEWQVPRFETDPQWRMAWIEEQLQEGEGWLSGLKAYKNLSVNMRIFDAIFNDKTRSTLVTNELKYDIRKMIETIADVREIGTYGSDVPAYSKWAEMLNRPARAIYLESDYSLCLLKVLQYAAVMGVGYMWPQVVADNYGYGERKFRFEDLGLLDVIPVQVPKSNDVQDAYAVTVYKYMPIAEAHGRFPLFQSELVPINHQDFTSRVQARRLDYAETSRFGEQSGERRNFGSLTCEIRYTFVKDLRINTTGYVLPMGDPGTSWFHEVPSVGMQIFGGYRNGSPFMRPARLEDCRVYPTGRLMISSKGMNRPMYDGPNFDWDGKIPPIQFTVDDWAWEPGGRSLVGDVGSIEVTKRKIERKMDQVVTTSLNPPMGYDNTATGGPKIEHFDVFEENVRVGVQGQPTQVLQSLLPSSVNVNAVHFQFLEYLQNTRKGQLGLLELAALQNLKMNMTSDQAQEMLESIGPLAIGIAMRIERGNKKVAEKLKFLILQYMDTGRLMQYVPPESVAPQVFDFDPASIVPSHLPDEIASGQFPITASYYSQLTRARWFAKNLRLISWPNTQIRMNQMAEQLKYLQLKRGNAPISWSTVMKKLNVENYGEVEGATEFEKWVNETKKMNEIQIINQAQAAQMIQQLGLAQPTAPTGPGAPPPPGAPGNGGPHPGGRPPSGSNPPKIEQKGGAGGTPRTVISESK